MARDGPVELLIHVREQVHGDLDRVLGMAYIGLELAGILLISSDDAEVMRESREDYHSLVGVKQPAVDLSAHSKRDNSHRRRVAAHRRLVMVSLLHGLNEDVSTHDVPAVAQNIASSNYLLGLFTFFTITHTIYSNPLTRTDSDYYVNDVLPLLELTSDCFHDHYIRRKPIYLIKFSST